jgi:hypothetical protein
MSPTKVETPRCCLQVDHLVTSLEVSSTNSSLHARLRSRLFWAKSSPTTTECFLNTPHPLDFVIPHNLYPTLLYCAQTGEVPVAIYFNNHLHKGLMDEWWGKLWWNNLGREDERFRGIVLRRIENATVAFVGGDRKRWSGICSNHNLLDV